MIIPKKTLSLGRNTNISNNNHWAKIQWKVVQKTVFKYQRNIYTASKLGQMNKIRELQERLFNSHYARLLAVRRVTQDNRGKNTAGVDGVKNIAPEKRFSLAAALKFPTKASPLRRVWIPKPGKTEKRPLGIPTIKDRALQALFKMGMEPEWEAKFEPNSYGFRPGRNCHDATKATLNFMLKGSKYVADVDIAKCFCKIDHKALLGKIGMSGKYRKQIKYWLEAGVLDDKAFSETKEGTPQGGVISPLLANIALHGLEDHLKKFVTQFDMYRPSGAKVKNSQKSDTLGVIRYADDFVILHPDRKIILACLEETNKWLADMGLEISKSKTRVTHTLKLQSDDTVELGFDGKIGFNFLGFTFKQFRTKYRSAKDTRGNPLNFKTLVYPSKEKMKSHQARLHELVLGRGKKLNQEALIKLLNPIIRGWSNYFGVSDAGTVQCLNKMDNLLYLKIRRWTKRVKGTAKKGLSFFRRIGNRKWVFATKYEDNLSLLNHMSYSNPISTYIKVNGKASIYDGNQKYWQQRLMNSHSHNSRVARLIKKQKGNCAWCDQYFQVTDIMEVDHILPKVNGGTDGLENLQLLHRHCHDQKTATDPEKPMKKKKKKKIPPKMEVLRKVPPRSCVSGKLSCTVLKQK